MRVIIYYTLIAILFSCNVSALSFVDGDFDRDGFIDRIEIETNENIDFSYFPTTKTIERKYKLEKSNDSDEGYSELFKSNGKNYIVYYFSDYATGDEYTENLYVWNSELNDFILYLTADITKDNSGTDSVQTKIAKCCYKLGGNNEVTYYSGIELNQYVSTQINNIKQWFSLERYDLLQNITYEEIQVLSGYVSNENKELFIKLSDFFKSKGDNRSSLIIINSLKLNSDLSMENNVFKDKENIRLKGLISVDKAMLYNSMNYQDKMKAYLVRGDVIDLLGNSDDKKYYKISYLMRNGKNLVAWISSDDFSVKDN
jgi:hypothetical protein